MKYKLHEETLTVIIYDDVGREVYSKTFESVIIFHCARLSLQDAKATKKLDDRFFRTVPWKQKTALASE